MNRQSLKVHQHEINIESKSSWYCGGCCILVTLVKIHLLFVVHVLHQ